MLIEGFQEKSTMYINYNYPYYPKHMDALDLFREGQRLAGVPHQGA